MHDDRDAPLTNAPDDRQVVGSHGQELRLDDGRLTVANDGRVVMDIGIAELRRIQFDIERDRPATLVIVPEDPLNAPQVVPIPAEHFSAVGDLLAVVGQRLEGSRST